MLALSPRLDCANTMESLVRWAPPVKTNVCTWSKQAFLEVFVLARCSLGFVGIFFLHTVLLYSCAGKCRWNYIGSLLFSHASVVSRNIRIALIACARLMPLRAPYFTQRVHVYEAVSYDGEPEESEEMRPKWFSVTELPLKVRMPILFCFVFNRLHFRRNQGIDLAYRR